MTSSLCGSARPLSKLYDVALLDLDGVVYIGEEAVPGAAQVMIAARADGMRLAFVTNNAARPPQVVADHLNDLGVEASADEIVTSAQAAARFLADRLPAHARVLVLGTTGLEDALRESGLNPVADARGDVDAVVQGYSPDLDWRLLAEGAVAINRGVLWVATNVDPTVPSSRGPLPGNGSLVAALRHATGAEPVVTGKPDPTMHREALLRTKAQRPIVVGDRLDTDIEGANAVGCPSLLVFSGVSAPGDVLAAGRNHRPTYLAADVRGLLDAHPEPATNDQGASCGRWIATRVDGGLQLAHSTHAEVRPSRRCDSPLGEGIDGDALDALRALCAAQWGGSDDGAPTSGDVRVVTGQGDDAACAALGRLGIDVT